MAISLRDARMYRTTTPLNFNSAYTVMAWVRLEVDRNDFSVIWMFGGSNWDNTNSYEYYGTDGSGTDLHVAGHPAMSNWTGGALPLDTWVHVAMVRETVSGPISVYRDGVLVGTATGMDATGRETVQIMVLGAFGGAGYSPFHGAIGLARSWDVALSAGEILAEMNSELAVKTAGLYADWPLTGIAGVRNQDVSGAGRHLTETGTITTVAGPDLDPTIYIAGSSSFTLSGSAALTVQKAIAGSASMTLSGTADIGIVKYLRTTSGFTLEGVANLSVARYLAGVGHFILDGSASLTGGIDVIVPDSRAEQVVLQVLRRRRRAHRH